MSTTRLKRVVTMSAGGTPTADDPKMWDDEGLPWVAIADMTRSPVVTKTERRVSVMGLDSKRLRVGQPGTLLFAMYASVGAIATLGVEATWNQAILGLVSRSDRADLRFVRYWLEHLRPHLGALIRSNTQDNLNAEQVGNFPFPTLALDEQRAIADYLDRETARIDAIITAKERMEHLVDQREFAVASYLAVPAGCRFVHLRYLATLQSGITVDGGRNLGTDAVRRPYLRVANVQAGRLNLDEVTEISVPAAIAARSTLRVGDVVMTEGGDIDKLGRGTVWNDEVPGCLHQNHIFAVRPDHAKLDAEYLTLLTMSAHARAYFESTGVQSTNLASTSASKIMSLPVPALSAQSQTRLVSEWKREAAHLGALRQALAQQIRLLREHRQALITAAVTGQVEVPVAA